MRIKYLRWISLGAVFAIVTIGLLLNTNLGTLSSFGWQAIATICPLGVIESMLASKSIFLQALVVLLAVVLFVAAFGKAFCSWVCPVAPIRSLRAFVSRRFAKEAKAGSGPSPLQGLPGKEGSSASPPLQGSPGQETDSAEGSAKGEEGVRPSTAVTADFPSVAATTTCSSCATPCSAKRAKLDSRHLVLGGSLLSAAIFGFPVFCLLCPIGLIFGTIIVAWQFFGFGTSTVSLLVYPLILILELVVFRKWCSRLCPMGALLSLLSFTNRLFRPRVNEAVCLHAQGGSCKTCTAVCKEGVDLHTGEGLHECSKCGLCKGTCPAGAISIPVFSSRKMAKQGEPAK